MLGGKIIEIQNEKIIEEKATPIKFGSEVEVNSEVLIKKKPKIEPEKVVLPKANGIMMGSDYLAALPKTTFQNLLIEFNSLWVILSSVRR